jgi:hypothetical protein
MTTPEYSDTETADKEARIAAAAARALMEAAERRSRARPLDLPKEVGGRDGPEPVRFGDWELNGIATDF